MFKTPNLKFENFKLKKFKKKISKIDSSYLNSFKILDTLKPKFNYSFNSKDIKRIKKEINWKPKISIEEGINELKNSINEWKSAPIWTPEKIKKHTKKWFYYLGKNK